MATKTATASLSYTETEIRSYLPSGWNLIGESVWDSKKRIWRATVIDNVDFDWSLEVDSEEAAKLGRLEALRRAFDELYRERLG